VPMVRLLAAFGADIDAKDVKGQTPLMKAAEDGKVEMARLLVELGADLNAHDNDGETSLMRAVNMRESNMIRLISSLGVDLNGRDNVGQTALHKAVTVHSDIEIARLLVSLGARIDVVDENGSTPIFTAAACGHVDAVRFLRTFSKPEPGAEIETKLEDELMNLSL